MYDVARILETLPLGLREDGAPRARAARQRLEAAHLLHAVQLGVAEHHARQARAWVLRRQAPADGAEVRGAEPGQHGGAEVVPAVQVVAVAAARVRRRQRVGAALGRLGDGVQRCGAPLLPAEPEEAGAEVARRVNHAVRVAGPQRRRLCCCCFRAVAAVAAATAAAAAAAASGRMMIIMIIIIMATSGATLTSAAKEMAVSRAQPDARGESFERAGVRSGGRELLKVSFGV